MQSPNVPPVVISTTVHLAVALAFSLTAFKERQFAVRKLVASVRLAEEMVALQVFLEGEGLLTAGDATHVEPRVVPCWGSLARCLY